MTRVEREEWCDLLTGSPQLRQERRPLGWVVESPDREIVGFLGNVPLAYQLDGRPLVAAAMHSWAVDGGYRPQSLFLTRAFLRQPSVDLALNTTANAAAGRALEALRFRRVPVADLDRCLFWVTGPRGFASSTLRRWGWPLAGALGTLLGVGLAGVEAIRGRSAPAEEVSQIEAFDGRFDALWERIRRRPGLLQVRSRECLDWAFHHALRRGELRILGALRGDGLVGYALLRRHDAPAIGLRRMRLIDVQVDPPGDPDLVRALVGAAIDSCRAERDHILELVGFGVSTRDAVGALGPRVRGLPSWPFYYLARSAGYAPRLESPDAWEPSQMDGDAAFQ